MKKHNGLDWPNMTDEQVRLTRDYASSPKERRQARQELSERSALVALRDEVVHTLAVSGEDTDTRIRATREWRRRVVNKR
jgi:hypothetical protein